MCNRGLSFHVQISSNILDFAQYLLYSEVCISKQAEKTGCKKPPTPPTKKSHFVWRSQGSRPPFWPTGRGPINQRATTEQNKPWPWPDSPERHGRDARRRRRKRRCHLRLATGGTRRLPGNAGHTQRATVSVTSMQVRLLPSFMSSLGWFSSVAFLWLSCTHGNKDKQGLLFC